MVNSTICVFTDIICMFTTELPCLLSPWNIQCTGNRKESHWLNFDRGLICLNQHFKDLVLRSWHYCPVSFSLFAIACSLRDDSSFGRVYSHNRYKENKGQLFGAICGLGSTLSKHNWDGEINSMIPLPSFIWHNHINFKYLELYYQNRYAEVVNNYL